MPPYRCKMALQDGRVVENTILGDSKDMVKARLENEGHFVIDIKKIKESEGGIKRRGGYQKPTNKEIYSFNMEFSVLLRAGLSVVGALDAIIEKNEKSGLTGILKTIRSDISGGASLSGAFSNYVHIFSNLYVATLKAGEMSGNVPAAISKYMQYTKKVAEIRQKIISASVYPLILLMASFSVLVFLLLFVVPAITESFLGSGKELPYMTQLILDLSNGLKQNYITILVLLAVFFISWGMYRKTPGGRLIIDRYKLSIPFFGTLTQSYATSKLFRTLATVISGGMTLIESFKTGRDTVDNLWFKKKIGVVEKYLQEGESFAESLKNTQMFPDLSVRMVAAGEASGALEEIFNEVADFYEAEVDATLSMVTSAIEPTLMIFMGITIGVIVLSMYLPIFQMAGTIG